MNNYRFLITICFWCYFACAKGQGVEYIGVSDGLSQGLITSRIQDKEGFLWFGTLSGLNRYDGRSFKSFYHAPFDSLSLRNDRIFGLAEVDDFILVGTEAGGIDAYAKKTGAFHPVIFPEDSLGLSTMRGVAFVQVPDKRWFGIFINKMGESYFVRFHLNISAEGRLSATKVRQYLGGVRLMQIASSPDSNYLYGSSSDTLYRINLSKRPLYFDKYSLPEEITNGSFQVAIDGKLWFPSLTAISYFDQEAWRVWETDFSSKALGIIEDHSLVVSTNSGEL